MRNIIVCNLVSLDGFYSGPGGNLDVMPFDKGFSDYNAERLRTADALLLGRNTFAAFRAYWPGIADDVSQQPVEREVSRLNTAVEKIVVSNSLDRTDAEGWGVTRILRRPDAYAALARLKETPGGDILIFGSRTLWNELLAVGLVDEVHLMIGPGVVNEGVPAFEKSPIGALRLLDTRSFDGSSLVLLRYRIERTSALGWTP